MSDDRRPDYYEALQISANAEPDTVHRVFRLLAQRFHPDNQETGDISQFRAISEAYAVLSDPEQRARYDVQHQEIRRDRLRLVDASNQVRGTFQVEQLVRLTVLEALYAQRKLEPNNPGIFDLDLEGITGQSREHLSFTFWYLIAKKLISRGDQSRLIITADGVDYLEQNFEVSAQLKRLEAGRGERLSDRAG
jgi:curved DNA-binding protein CbpA